jgi:hypothetical protein
MRAEGNVLKNGEPSVNLFFTTMLQHTGSFDLEFLSKEECDNSGEFLTL